LRIVQSNHTVSSHGNHRGSFAPFSSPASPGHDVSSGASSWTDDFVAGADERPPEAVHDAVDESLFRGKMNLGSLPRID